MKFKTIMISRPTFHLFLSLSILVILIGIALIIFTQFDRGSVATDTEQKDYSKQQELIHQIAETIGQRDIPPTEVRKQVNTDQPADQSVLNLIEQVKHDDRTAKSADGDNQLTRTDQEIARINQLNRQTNASTQPYRPYTNYGYGYNSQDYYLSNNPWSPYYDPRRP